MLKKVICFLKYGEKGFSIFRCGFRFLHEKRRQPSKKIQISAVRKSDTPIFLRFNKSMIGKVVRQAKWLGRIMAILAKRYF